MADISIRQSHQLTAEKARAAAEKVADEMTSEFDMVCVWEGDVLNFKRSGVSGTLALLGQEVQLDITLGLMLQAFAAKIEEKLGENMAKVFASSPVV